MFNTWGKAGALKAGGTLSTRSSIETANDNDPDATPAGAPLTLRAIKRSDTEQRGYNFAVQSLPGELTHNYLAGDVEWWTHNVQRKLGPSGKPMLHFPKLPNRKKAKDAARNSPGSCVVMFHSSPRVGNRHFHSTGPKGKKIPDGVHYEY